MNTNSYSSLCDDFYLDMYVNTELDLPTQRDTLLTFFERVQKQYPSMGRFYRRDENEYCLEEDRRLGQYRWVALESDRLGSGVANPPDFEMAYAQNRFILDLIPYMLGVGPLDIDSLDVAFAMDFDCLGSHDEVIAEALFASSAFSSLLDLPYAKPIGFSPSMILAISEDQYTQARLSVDSKTSVFEPGQKRDNAEQAISLALTIRQYPTPDRKFEPIRSFDHQCHLAEEIMAERVVPSFVQPLIETIAQRRSG